MHICCTRGRWGNSLTPGGCGCIGNVWFSKFDILVFWIEYRNMHPPNDRWHYIVTLSVIGWVHTQNDPCNNMIQHALFKIAKWLDCWDGYGQTIFFVWFEILPEGFLMLLWLQVYCGQLMTSADGMIEWINGEWKLVYQEYFLVYLNTFMIFIGCHNNVKCCCSFLNNMSFNTLSPDQNGWHFADDIFKWI